MARFVGGRKSVGKLEVCDDLRVAALADIDDGYGVLAERADDRFSGIGETDLLVVATDA